MHDQQNAFEAQVSKTFESMRIECRGFLTRMNNLEDDQRSTRAIVASNVRTEGQSSRLDDKKADKFMPKEYSAD
jgi:hypothetical protein